MKDNQRLNDQDYVKLAKENIYKQAGMAGLAVIVTIVLIFAMSVAWYSNVIHNEGLVFQASSWDFEFEGNIEFDGDKKHIAPGESGIVNLKVENDSTEAISVLVNMVKDDNMTTEMKKRIYCYVDDSKISNGELVQKIYVNGTDSYAYDILAKNTLLLSEDYHSHPYLKWEWVYDVVGYYVSGTMDASDKLIIDDYMRPVTYDYDNATYDEEGNLLTVNNGISKEEYLKELYETDGYAGSYDKNKVTKVGDYYPVVVDKETNSGIWLYLCTENEIEANIAYDTQQSINAAEGNAKEILCRLLLSGEKSKQREMTVSNAADLAEELKDVAVDKVIMDGDITLTEPIAVKGGKSVVLDLDGNTLSLVKSGNSIEVDEGSSLTIVDGTLDGSGAGVAVHSVGGVVTMDQVVVTDVDRAIYVEDDKGTGLDSRIRISNSQFDVKSYGLVLRGNAGYSSRNTKVVIEKSTITCGQMGISGNGTAWGTDIEIIESRIEGYWAGIYHPERNSKLLVKDSTIVGYTAIAIKAGDVEIVDSVVEGRGAKNEAAFAKSGFTDTGDAVYIETNYNDDIHLTVNGSKTLFKSLYSEAIQVYEPDAPHVNVEVMGGRFNTDITDFVPRGYVFKQDADNFWTVGEQPASDAQ